MILPWRAGNPLHGRFADLPQHLEPGDLVVVNRTRVIPARLEVRRPTGGRVELLAVRPIAGDLTSAEEWEVLARPAKSLKPGLVLTAADGTDIIVVERTGETARVRARGGLLALLNRVGEVPLPPYIDRPQGPVTRDALDYQTVFASEPGAVAAPTAGLHFTDRILDGLKARGVTLAQVVLHVGIGTFLPVRQEHYADVRGHSMHPEWYRLPPETVAAIESCRGRGGRVVAVGTTSLRALETWASTGMAEGESRLFVYPGFSFRVVDAMVTNFHLPKSTLLVLVAAFVGRERILEAYAEAVARGYRFFSYGDAMLLYRDQR